MSARSPIEWTQDTWNPIAGCSVHSPGCKNCYAMRRVAPRLAANPATPHYAGTVMPSKAGPVFTGVVNLAGDAVLMKPLRWKKPRMIFVNSTSDLFHENVPDAWIDRIFAVMALAPQHTFQVLTKRAARMREYMTDSRAARRVYSIVCDMVLEGQAEGVLIAPGIDPSFAPHGRRIFLDQWPLPNVWLGVSAEDQTRADERIPHLLATPAAVLFVSAEPLLGPIDFNRFSPPIGSDLDLALRLSEKYGAPPRDRHLGGINWVIVGGETGSTDRPTHPAWVRSIRDQCATAKVPFFFKQWGVWFPEDQSGYVWLPSGKSIPAIYPWPDGTSSVFVGKKRAGRLLDGVEHNGMPRVRP